MTTLLDLAHRQPVVLAHLLLALGALALGLVILLRPKGRGAHRWMGWSWALLMGGAALTSAFIASELKLSWHGVSPIHALTALVLWQLPRGVWLARRGRIAAHRATMRSLYIGSCVVAGAFTLLPGRLLGGWLWRDALGLLG